MLRFLLLALLLVGGFRDFYCPACARFSADQWTLDVQGLCKGCGRRPALIDAVSRTWFWCEEGESWREQPCARDRDIRCCSPWTATAMNGAPPHARLGEGAFCPQCRRSADGQERCPGCDKAPVVTTVADLVWLWCGRDRVWALSPCAHGCPERRETRVLTAWPVPLPYPVGRAEVAR
jgi:hypothetical protein